MRKKQKIEQKNLAEVRDMRRLKLLDKELENQGNYYNQASPDSGKKRPKVFEDNLHEVEFIFKALDPYRDYLLKKRATMLM